MMLQHRLGKQERVCALTNHLYGSLVSTVNSTPHKSSSLKVSIGWWLIPSVICYLLAIVIFR
jgi:hypothetical protein